MSESMTGEARRRQQSKTAAASGWIGSALEYYDFFIYATAASLVFPQVFFPSQNPTVAIFASMATFGVGYVARPLGAIALGHWGDTHGRKTVLLACMFLMGFSTMAVGLLPTYDQIGIWAPVLLVIARLVQGFAVAGEVSGASSMILEHAPFGRRGFFASFTLQGVQAGQLLAAAAFLPLAELMPQDQFVAWGWRIPFLLSVVVIVAGYFIRRKVDETPAFAAEAAEGKVPAAPLLEVLRSSPADLVRVVLVALSAVIAMIAGAYGATYAVQPAYGIGFPPAVYLWIPVLGNLLAVMLIPFIGDLSDRIGRRTPLIVGVLAAGATSFAYLYAISIHNMWLSIVLCLLMWGIFFQGFQAIFPSFFPEMFRTRVRVTGMALGANIGTTLSGFLPALFVAIAPPGTTDIPLRIGGVTFCICVVAAIAVFTARETHRVRLEHLGDPNAVPVPKDEFDRIRAEVIASSRMR